MKCMKYNNVLKVVNLILQHPDGYFDFLISNQNVVNVIRSDKRKIGGSGLHGSMHSTHLMFRNFFLNQYLIC
jgi:hypothetical protein